MTPQQALEHLVNRAIEGRLVGDEANTLRMLVDDVRQERERLSAVTAVDFQVQAAHLGTDREQCQLTLRGSAGVMVHMPIEMVEWSQAGYRGCHAFSGRFPKGVGFKFLKPDTAEHESSTR